MLFSSQAQWRRVLHSSIIFEVVDLVKLKILGTQKLREVTLNAGKPKEDRPQHVPDHNVIFQTLPIHDSPCHNLASIPIKTKGILGEQDPSHQKWRDKMRED